MRIAFIDALTKAIIDLQKPIVSSFDIFSEASKIHEDNGYMGYNLYHQNKPFDKEKTSALIKALQKGNALYPDPDFKRYYYRVAHLDDGSAQEVCCLIDPFCYISHLSAMRRYDLTDRIPATSIFSTPDKATWEKMKLQHEEEVLHSTLERTEYMPIRKSTFPKTVRGMKIQRIETKFSTNPIKVKGSYARISEIGATFVDMLEKPSLCGGMSHILEVWDAYAELYMDEIIKAVDNNPKKLIKVRAGYILDEVIGYRSDRIYKWLENAQRGSSQVLNPDAPFAPTFSEKWMLSINV